MKQNNILTILLFFFALAGVANAQTGSGTLGVTATVEGSITINFLTDPSGVALTGTDTSAATLPFGTVRRDGGSLSANVTRTINETTFDLSTPFDIRVDSFNSASSTYTLTATLAVADIVNNWLIDEVDISSGAPFALTAAGVFAAVVPYTLTLRIPNDTASGVISNSIGFTAVGD